MKLEYKVNTLEQGKRLAELGVKAESYFVWIIKLDIGGARDKWTIVPREYLYEHHYYDDRIYAAYSYAEFEYMLPPCITYKDKEYTFGFHYYTKTEIGAGYYFSTCECWGTRGELVSSKCHTNKTYACAELLIDVVKRKLINPKNLKL